ncbi:diphosphate--fructose-6-phosphate 1-phosphotransferase [Candidatus Magnetomorum sp. HK-1]|nr:diphosphate--fructose-6-phosphate 1-phosphotransferase [Candidatus Magnetomorum sp. HK-1]
MDQRREFFEQLMNDDEIRTFLDDKSLEAKERNNFHPPLCEVFRKPFTRLKAGDHNFFIDPEAKKELHSIINNKVQYIVEDQTGNIQSVENFNKKRRIGIVFSGGPSPGGHSVIAGLFDAAQKANPDSVIIGFLMGLDGVIENESIELTKETVDHYRNLGGFTMIKTGRAKIDSPEKIRLSRQTCKQLELDALVIVGGDDSNTNAAFLAQELIKDGIQVIGVPKTIDGDVQVRDEDGNVLCAISFGFHSAARSYAQQISHLCSDGSSDVKYWHVCKVMGRVASHIALEAALQTHANMTLIGEDLINYVDHKRLLENNQEGEIDFDAYGVTLNQLSKIVSQAIVRRARYGKNHGILIIPEGILEFINEIQKFIIKLNTIIADFNNTHDKNFHAVFTTLNEKLEYLNNLTENNKTFSIWNKSDDEMFNEIPAFFREDLLMERDTHGNFPFSLVETEKVLMGLVDEYLNMLFKQGDYKIGVERAYFERAMTKNGLAPQEYGPILFEKYDDLTQNYLLMKKPIICNKSLKQILIQTGKLKDFDDIHPALLKILKKAIPNFKTRLHFYGYDGRGSNPTRFDCMYAYNLGHSVFSLVANGTTGQMAAIKNLEKGFDHWEPIGIPLAPLMHLEERKGKLSLVMEKSIVDTESPAFKVVKSLRERWLAANESTDCYRKPAPIRFTGDTEEDRPITLILNGSDTLTNILTTE